MKYYNDEMLSDDDKRSIDGSAHHKHQDYWDCESTPDGECATPEITDCKQENLYSPTKECVKTYKCYYKLYKICHYELHKVCPRCGQEFDYHYHQGVCPTCF